MAKHLAQCFVDLRCFRLKLFSEDYLLMTDGYVVVIRAYVIRWVD
jgi:hypothetical protein